MNTTLTNLINLLKFWGRVQPSEGFHDPDDLTNIITQAVGLHNSAYVVSSSACTVPAKEEYVVTLLAWSLLCTVRATKFANEASIRADGFVSNRDTPFEKNLKLADLLRKRYEEQCKIIGLTIFAGAGPVRVSQALSVEADTGAMLPFDISQEPPLVQLTSEGNIGSGTLILVFTTTLFDQFAARYVFHSSGSEPLHQPWNFASAVFPGVDSAATKLMEIGDQRLRQIKLTNLVTTPGTVHRFLVATKTRSDVNGYSNELVLTLP